MRQLHVQGAAELADDDLVADSSRHVVVTGAGVAGLASALILGRAGHRVTLLERYALPASGPPGSWFDWRRRGIPHFHQPHAFIPRGRALLREVAPDVYSAMLEAGAREVPGALPPRMPISSI